MLRLIAAAVLLVLGLAQAHAANSPPTYGDEWCTKSGGAVQTRIPTFGTNNNATLALAQPRKFCAYASHDGSSTIYVLISTLVSETPTLATLAYYAEVPFTGTCAGSPGSCYCSQIGGTDLFGGINAAGGGWVLDSNANDVLDACIFPDLSSIDTYGLFYHSAGIIRGRNLAHKLRYKNPN
jgi:hypothetical protein